MKKVKVVGVCGGTDFSDDCTDVVDQMEWHAPNIMMGDHDTMCGIDADDETIGHYGLVEAVRGQKITCGACKHMYQQLKALRLRDGNFE